MRTATPITLVSVLALAVTACSGAPQRPRYKAAVIERALAGAPGEAQPSTVVATEVALSQAEKEDGTLKAHLEFAAPGAIWHISSGTIDIAANLPRYREIEGTADWSTRTVVMSCDGALAIAMGRFRNRQGLYGDYLTTWERQRDNTYKFTYTTEWIDDPQPAPRERSPDGDIVVTAIDAIQGLVASCPRADAPVPPPPAISLASDNPGAAQLSRDGTLRWRWEHRPDETKYVVVDYWYEGEWVRAIEEGLASPDDR